MTWSWLSFLIGLGIGLALIPVAIYAYMAWMAMEMWRRS